MLGDLINTPQNHDQHSRQPSLTTGISLASLLSRSYHYPFAANVCQFQIPIFTQGSDSNIDSSDRNTNQNSSSTSSNSQQSNSTTTTDDKMPRSESAITRSSTASSSPNSSHISIPGTLSNAISWTLQRWNSAGPKNGTSPASSGWRNSNGRSQQNGKQENDYLSSFSRNHSTSRPPSRPPSAASHRRASPFQPPPLPPLSLHGYSPNTTTHLLNCALAEEIRQLIPPRLQLHDAWSLVYSLEQHGVSLATLYERCAMKQFQRGGFVLVVKDDNGGVFGAFVNERFKPSGGRYYGTGECFLWKAGWADLAKRRPEQFSRNQEDEEKKNGYADEHHNHNSQHSHKAKDLLAGDDSGDDERTLVSTGYTTPISITSGAQAPPAHRESTEKTLKFKAFPYSGVNEYMILCEHDFLSIGGGDGRYGLWLDDIFEKGISSPCPTFGNEPLSDEGEKFEIIGVEVWSIGGIAL